MHALLLVLLTLPAGAQTGPDDLGRIRARAEAPTGLPGQQREYLGDAGADLWAKARSSFLRDERAQLPDPAALEAIARTLPADSAAQAEAKEFSAAVWQAGYVQQGPYPDEDYRALVDYVAARLGVPPSQAEAVYLAPGRRPVLSAEAPDPVWARQLRQEAQTFRHQPVASKATLQNAQRLAARLGDRVDQSYITAVEKTIPVNGNQVPTGIVRGTAFTSFAAPPPGLGPPSVETLVAEGKLPKVFLKYSAKKGQDLAAASATFGLSTSGDCLTAVKQLLKRWMEKTGICGDRGSGESRLCAELPWMQPSRAYDFASRLAPQALDKLHLLRLDPEQVADLSTLPRGTLIAYPPGVCGTDPNCGHIELVTQQGIPEQGVPTVAESDFPHKVNFRCVRRALVYIPID